VAVSITSAQATWLHGALLLGLVDGADATSWADELIARYQSPHDSLTDVSLTNSDDLSALRFALQPLCDEAISPDVAAALLDSVGWALTHGELSAVDAFAVLRQARQMLKLPAVYDAEIRDIGMENYLAVNTPGGEAGVAARLGDWLSKFRGSHDRLFAPRRYHLVVFQRVTEAAAFVAALSRWLASPASGNGPADDIEVWSTIEGSTGVVYLSDAALVSATARFAPVPVSGIGAPPKDAIELIVGECNAMGVDETRILMEGAVF